MIQQVEFTHYKMEKGIKNKKAPPCGRAFYSFALIVYRYSDRSLQAR
jgi:hypothetical protein